MPGVQETSKTAPEKAASIVQDHGDLDAINTAIDRMRAVTEPDPYVLTIPQDVEPRYHHAYQYAATQWLHQAPFQWKEGELVQYQTFVYHEPGKEMYVQHPTRPKEPTDGALGQAKGQVRPATAVGTPNTNVMPKKTISLDAYKKKQTGGSTPAQQKPSKTEKHAEAAPAKSAVVKGPSERVKVETEEVLAAAAAAAEEDAVVSDPPVKPDAADVIRKRKREAEDTVQTKRQAAIEQAGEQPAEKKARTESLPHAHEGARTESLPFAPANTKEAPPLHHNESPLPEKAATLRDDRQEDDDDAGLPPRLSPLNESSLPERLSPTIPANIAATLKARERSKHTGSDSSTSSVLTKNGKLTPIQPTEGVTKRKSPIPRNGFRAHSSSPAMRSDAEDNGRSAAISAPPPRVQTPELSREDKITVAKVMETKRTQTPELVVKFKVKKHQREAVRRILKMRPNPTRTAELSAQQTNTVVEEPRSDKPAANAAKKRDPNAKGVAQRVGPPPAAVNGAAKQQESKRTSSEERSHTQSAGPVTSRKRPAPSADTTKPTEAKKDTPRQAETANEEPPAKRRKAPADLETTKNPSTPIQPDLPSPAMLSSAHKSQQATPSFRKDHLSAIAMTREHSVHSNADTPSAKSNTPLADGHASQPNGTNTARPPSSQPSNKTPLQQAWETEQKRLETLGRDLKHAAQSHLNALKLVHSDPAAPLKEQKLAAVKSIESLLAYFLAFTSADEAALAADPKQPPPSRNWRTLHGFFSFVKRSCEAFPLLSGLASHLGVVYCGHILDLSTLYAANAKNLGLDAVAETHRTLLRSVREGEEKLDIEALQSDFPVAWSRRAKGAVASNAVKAGAFAGAYKLPLGLQSSPVVATRAGYTMLEEWVGKQGMEYSLQLKL
ncbi:hypothetical protein BAUCODRAFT_139141 [Baudoinia panamericana UAMH 10762]|uniref:Uncharacterized protein n=1 Tax=Baudoinia panamericana (strain UAMH 10762) TaxID=717646 RepID=M2NBM4_BAUPA|nr:uncharacterized protein BAUCODRAFT_139141 [Baudoinia panamericana UAMH 10762]EMC96310.1 hypothetical protein BAUCODRAFT_139141 [Baudoinia panamericana UAMH 10762]